MTQPEPAGEPPAPADPTVQVPRPPVPGRAAREAMAAGELPTPPVRHDDPTVTLGTGASWPPHRTLRFGAPPPMRVTVAPRPRPRRRCRTWPWIAAVVLALVVLGVVLLVMLMRGETIDGDVDLVGQPWPVVSTVPR
jgi:hypothetical protein